MFIGSYIIDVNSGVDEYGFLNVNILFDFEGGNKMFCLICGNIGKLMVMVFIEYKLIGECNKDGKLVFEKYE